MDLTLVHCGRFNPGALWQKFFTTKAQRTQSFLVGVVSLWLKPELAGYLGQPALVYQQFLRLIYLNNVRSRLTKRIPSKRSQPKLRLIQVLT
jgi:hypothetical protein